jgi:DnaJ-class molecular chaperone
MCQSFLPYCPQERKKWKAVILYTQEQIKNIDRRLSLIYHPDTGKYLGVDGEQRFRKIKEAYDFDWPKQKKEI